MRRLLVATALLAMLVLRGTPAGALAANALSGTGTLTPGLPAVPGSPGLTGTAESFAGTAAGVFMGSAGACNISFQGSSSNTGTFGVGSGTLSCGGTAVLGPGISFTCPVAYQRQATAVVITGSCSGTSSGSFTAVATYTPTSVNPTTTYAVVGDAVIGTGTAFHFAGTGQYSSGYFLTVANVATATTNFSGTMVGVFGTTVGTCTLNGTGNAAGSAVTGAMGVFGNCNGAGVSLSCGLVFSWAGPALTVSGNCSGSTSGTVTGTGEFMPTSVNPTTSYALVATLAIT